MVVKLIDFSELSKQLIDNNQEFMDFFVKKSGRVHVIAVTREKCPGCEKQKPLFEKLSEKMKLEYGNQVEFTTVYAHYSQESKEEAASCLETFQTVAFPTYIICLQDHRGKNLETYRALEPSMSEIERNIKTSVEILKLLGSRK
jgi:thiol-disulfide isomerase/thioredoxin